MLSKRAQLALCDIRDNGQLARQFVGAHSPESFKQDRMAFYAATRALEIVSEAVRRLPEDLKTRHPHLPWRQIMDAGNAYRHGYDDVAEARVYTTVQTSLPDLLVVIDTELARIE
jgi:uncharacterized protein with HEPN domain